MMNAAVASCHPTRHDASKLVNNRHMSRWRERISVSTTGNRDKTHRMVCDTMVLLQDAGVSRHSPPASGQIKLLMEICHNMMELLGVIEIQARVQVNDTAWCLGADVTGSQHGISHTPWCGDGAGVGTRSCHVQTSVLICHASSVDKRPFVIESTRHQSQLSVCKLLNWTKILNTHWSGVIHRWGFQSPLSQMSHEADLSTCIISYRYSTQTNISQIVENYSFTNFHLG